MAEAVHARRAAAGKKGAEAANRWRRGDRARGSRASSKSARKIPSRTRSKAAKKATRTRTARGR